MQLDVPRLHLLQGNLLLHASRQNFEAAEGFFRSAWEVARSQGARGWALRAMTSLTRLLAERGERAQARDRLTAIYAEFSEGFDTPDLQDAKALLDQLG
jgi:predicted ATPase